LIVGRTLAFSGIALLIAGLVGITLWADAGAESGTIFYSWMALQSISYLLSIGGFVILLRRHNGATIDKPKKSIKPVLKTAAYYSIILGLVLTFPLVQIGFPLFIAEILVAVGLTLMALSCLLWIIIFFFPRDRSVKQTNLK
jgi:hypothetical protein